MVVGVIVPLRWLPPCIGSRLTIYGGPSSPWVLRFLLYSELFCALLEVVFTGHGVTSRSRYSQDWTKAETWCPITALPEAKFTIQWHVFSEPYGTEANK